MGYGTLTRSGLTDALVENTGISRIEASELVETVLDEISTSLVNDEQVKLSSFGTFGVREKAERIGRNPKTGQEATICPRKVLYFKPSNILKKEVNEGNQGLGHSEAAE